jgi:hypothetical protein
MMEALRVMPWPAWMAMGIPAAIAYAIIMHRMNGVVTIADCMASATLMAFGPVASVVTVPLLVLILALTWKKWWLVGCLLRAPIIGKHRRKNPAGYNQDGH